MIHNAAFVKAVKEKQKKLGMTQAEFARHIEVTQGALSKFYGRGVKDGVTIKVLIRFPRLAVFFAPENSSCE